MRYAWRRARRRLDRATDRIRCRLGWHGLELHELDPDEPPYLALFWACHRCLFVMVPRP